MTVEEVREGVMKVKELEKKVENLVLKKEGLDVDVVGIDIGSTDFQEMREIVQDTEDLLEEEFSKNGS